MTEFGWTLGSDAIRWSMIGLLCGGLLGLFGFASVGSAGIDRIVDNQLRRIVANSATPLAAQLLNRAVDLVFAAIALRLLGVEGNGQYAIATVTWLYLKTFSDFGLSILAAREVARDPAQAGPLVGSTTLFRLLVLALSLPFVVLFVLLGQRWLSLSSTSAIAILLLTLSIVPASYSEAVNAIFTGTERMHLPAVLTVFTNLIRFATGVLALGHGLGVPGIAGAAVTAALCNAFAFHVALKRQHVRIQWLVTASELRRLAQTAWPLLLNGLLITLFFRVDTFIIQALSGSHALGIYDAAYKLPNLLPLIPSYFVLAVFPLLSRQSGSDLRRTYELAAKFLIVVSWLVVLVTLLAAPLFIRLLGGHAFLPAAAETLRILIWFAPLHFLNGITQYAVIATDRQRDIAPAYATATAFNIVANLLGVSLFGYTAAAVVTVLTEVVLFLFLRGSLERSLGRIDWSPLLWKPFLVFLCALLLGVLLTRISFLLSPLTVLVYVFGLLLTRTVLPHELALLAPLLPKSKSLHRG
ncbi:MAG: oligosaccharide flippase family protein [Thermomicrobium sp.]|nr:oligosaccharide flippase family protein [Thermomicrobium sp.]MCS7246125.1 oligosaccharide flippase family protein [Thermomicrobium sp.]MDW7981794.1 oligosaccharide flippase family protein [Thermomicrobium sp.]